MKSIVKAIFAGTVLFCLTFSQSRPLQAEISTNSIDLFHAPPEVHTNPGDLFHIPSGPKITYGYAHPVKHIELFNGTNLDGWTFYMRTNADPALTWSGTNGLIVCNGRPNGYARTEKPYGDCKVTVEWRFTKAGNTGVCVFMQDRDANTPTNLIWGNSIECQGMHDHQGDFWVWGGATCAEPFNNGRNGIKMPLPSSENPVGEWNTFQVVCKTNTVEIIVNGTSMNKITGCNNSSGYIGLQSEGGAWEARKIFIEPLTPDKL